MAYLRGGKDNWYLNGPRGMGGLGQTCSDGTPYLANFGCSDGGAPTCPAGSTLGTGPVGYQCTSASGSISVGTPAPSAAVANLLCPIGSTCSIIPGVSNTYVYLGGALLALALFLPMRGGR